MITSCPECNGKLSTEAAACPHCGYVQKSGTPGGPSPAPALPVQSSGWACPYCKAALPDAAAVACRACGRKWDKTFDEWHRASGLWAWLFWLAGTLGLVTAAFVSGWFNAGFDRVVQQFGRYFGNFMGNLFLSPFTWAAVFFAVMQSRASGRRHRAAQRERRKDHGAGYYGPPGSVDATMR